MSIEAMKQALEWIDAQPEPRMIRAGVICTALRQAIEQAEKQEPSRAQTKQIVEGLKHCHHPDSQHEFLRVWIKDWTAHKSAQPMTPEHLPQYIATDGKPMESGGGGVCSRPRKSWVGLTDDEIWLKTRDINRDEKGWGIKFARAIEAKLKEKNT